MGSMEIQDSGFKKSNSSTFINNCARARNDDFAPDSSNTRVFIVAKSRAEEVS